MVSLAGYALHCVLKYFLNADFSLKIISITPSAATAGAEAEAAAGAVAVAAAAFLSSLAAAAAVSVVVVVVVIRSPQSRRSASRLNATTLRRLRPRTANRQTWSIIFHGEHKLLMQSESAAAAAAVAGCSFQ